jgi:hypothetical protein
VRSVFPPLLVKYKNDQQLSKSGKGSEHDRDFHLPTSENNSAPPPRKAPISPFPLTHISPSIILSPDPLSLTDPTWTTTAPISVAALAPPHLTAITPPTPTAILATTDNPPTQTHLRLTPRTLRMLHHHAQQNNSSPSTPPPKTPDSANTSLEKTHSSSHSRRNGLLSG